MSSHREAPEISKDPVADSTDVYAFVSPDRPDTVTLIANYIPLQEPAGGPNFYEFGDDVLYEIHIDNDGDGRADVTYQFHVQHEAAQPGHVPVQHRADHRRWTARTGTAGSSTRSPGSTATAAPACSASDLACPPCNIGAAVHPELRRRSASAAVHDLAGGVKVFAGQRAEGFYVDLGAIFDLGDLRPFQHLHNQFGMNVFAGPRPA